MKSYLEWKKQYKDQFPPSWDQWLMMVHACLDVLEEANGDEAEKYRNRYQQIIDEKAKDRSPKWGCIKDNLHDKN